eukprot:1061519-Pelagomonas_calceolata.AAC.14
MNSSHRTLVNCLSLPRNPETHAVLAYVEVKSSAWHSKDAFEVSPAEMRWAQHHGPAYTVGAGGTCMWEN